MSPHEILGVDVNASESDIKAAYKKMALQHHPDRGGDAEKFKEINNAYEMLTKEKGPELPNMGDFMASSFFHDFLNMSMEVGIGMNNKNNANQHKEVIDHHLDITLQECYSGCQKSFKITFTIDCNQCTSKCSACNGVGMIERNVQLNAFTYTRTSMGCPQCSNGIRGITIINPECKHCNNTRKASHVVRVNLDVPAGFDFQNRLIIHEFTVGRKKIILKVKVNVSLEGHYKKVSKNGDILMELPILFKHTLTGMETEIILPSGKKHTLNTLDYNEIISEKDYLIKDAGLPSGDEFGDVIINFKIQYPKINKAFILSNRDNINKILDNITTT